MINVYMYVLEVYIYMSACCLFIYSNTYMYNIVYDIYIYTCDRYIFTKVPIVKHQHARNINM